MRKHFSIAPYIKILLNIYSFLSYALVLGSEQHDRLSKGAKVGSIYGADNRKDIYQIDNELYSKLYTSTAILMWPSMIAIDADNSGYSLIHPDYTYGIGRNLCPEVPYKDQVKAGFCSVLEAGQTGTTTFPSSQVYKCSSFISIENRGDYAIVTLDREVTDIDPAEIDSGANLPPGTPLVMIGYPGGIPAKVDDGAAICSTSTDDLYYYVNTDSFAGNSGSGVFHRITGKLIGILTDGLTDYVKPPNRTCYVNVLYNDDICGEWLTKLSVFQDYITTPPTISTGEPSESTFEPSINPTEISSPPTDTPSTSSPTSDFPTIQPSSRKPTSSKRPSGSPTRPTVRPSTYRPSSRFPSIKPSISLTPSTRFPTKRPSTRFPSNKPSTRFPSNKPSTRFPSNKPSTRFPSNKPPTRSPTARPSITSAPTTRAPSSKPSTRTPTRTPLA